MIQKKANKTKNIMKTTDFCKSICIYWKIHLQMNLNFYECNDIRAESME